MVDLIDTLLAARIVPVIRHHDPEIATLACELLVDAGALCVGMGGNLLPSKSLEVGDTGAARKQITAALTAASSNNS